MPVNIADIPGLAPTRVGSAQVSGRALAAPAAGLGDLAQSLAGLSRPFAQVAMQIQGVENGRILSEKRQQLASDYAAFQQDLQTDPDPQSRLAKNAAFLANYKQRLDTPDVPPAVRDQLDQHFGEFATRATIAQGEDSARLALQRGKLALSNELETARANQDRAGFQTAIQTARDAGILLPEQEEPLMKGFDRETDIRDFQTLAEQSPLDAEKAANDPGFAKAHPRLDPQTLDQLRAHAERQANRQRADTANDMVISGKMPTLEDLQVMEEAGEISKSTHARFATAIRSQEVEPPDDPAVYEETWGQIMAYDPEKDPSGRGEAEMRQWIATQPLPKEQRKVLNQKFTDRLNPEEAKKPKSVHESSFASKIGTDFTRGDFGKYRFPVDDDGDPSTPPKFPINAAAYDAAWKMRGEFTDQWRGIMAAMPEDATFEQVNQAFADLKTSFRDKTPPPALNFSPPKAKAFDPDALYNRTAPRGGSFGGQPIRPPGSAYRNAAATVFGGPDDPADNGRSAFGGPTGEGGREGTAIPQKLLAAKFPGKSKDWIAANVRTVVRGPDGVAHTLDVADFGTAEWVWEKNGRAVLDLTPQAARDVGGTVTYDANGKLAGVKGLDRLDFAVVSTATADPLKGLSWPEAKDSWFRANRPGSNAQAVNSLIALRDRWNKENMPKTDSKRNTGDLSQYNVITQ